MNGDGSGSTQTVIEAYRLSIDESLIVENLRHSPEERLRQLQELLRFAEELKSAGEKLRQERK